MDKNKPLQFTQLAGGNFFREAQEQFEEAQREAIRKGVSSKLSIEIAIAPPGLDDLTGAMGYSVHYVLGKKKAKVLNTLVNRESGLVYADGLTDPRQVQMFNDQFPEGEVDKETGEVLPRRSNVTTFEPRSAQNG